MFGVSVFLILIIVLLILLALLGITRLAGWLGHDDYFGGMQ
jgi:hypothetical protein